MSQNVDYKQLVDEWLESEEKDIEAGALLCLKLNRNRTLYQYITRKKALDKLIYEMKKQSDILSARVNFETNKLTEEEVKELTQKAVKAAKTVEVIDKGVKGKRTDHDKLPADIQQAYEDNLVIYPKMRSLHEKLKLMANDRPCDRYPFLKELVAMDNKVRANWKLYDNAKILNTDERYTDTGNPVSKKVTLDAKGVSAARKYLSSNKKKLATLKDTDEDKYKTLLAEMQKRYDDLIASGQTLDEKQVGELKEAGVKVGE
ncbi:hypothetical protein D0T84_16300 [Dysgonomonas sp. 521]|uniref:hypothetical protein n=1 Tax=Dysgonomonas sp. 521 TaxID=2302932 RepID=UPI0013D14D6C|nr:hypothetical protein [Dysgonomonas sp. 521]NDV96463.1 hypothetical protein [Dysgonomonas sp. 521]